MFCTLSTERKAAKDHHCTYCGETINKGDKYLTWKSVDDSWFTNKMHHECADDIGVWSDDGTYIPYDNERPKKDPS